MNSLSIIHRHKDGMKSANDPAEMLLFHGTESEYVDAICRENIDWRLCGRNGTRFGRGEFLLTHTACIDLGSAEPHLHVQSKNGTHTDTQTKL